ncbi:hypothetical protein N9444_08960 [Gammaproteobacteria bacterium]|nr:hypothetical protein [Gammaproteobacteria bacterium]
MKKSLILGLGMVLMALQANVWAATCATEKKAKGYMVKVLSPAMATVINKNDPFLVQYSDPGQSLGIVVTVALHTITGNKKAPKAVKALKNQPNSGSVLLTGANLMNPGSKADGKFFFRVSGAGKSVDSECFTFAPQLKGATKQTADAELQGLQQTVKTYAEQIAALTKKLAEVEKQLAATTTAWLTIPKQLAKGDGGGGVSVEVVRDEIKQALSTARPNKNMIIHLKKLFSGPDDPVSFHAHQFQGTTAMHTYVGGTARGGVGSSFNNFYTAYTGGPMTQEDIVPDGYCDQVPRPADCDASWEDRCAQFPEQVGCE